MNNDNGPGQTLGAELSNKKKSQTEDYSQVISMELRYTAPLAERIPTYE